MGQVDDRQQGRDRRQAPGARRPEVGPATEAERAARAVRLADEMRANLRKRKAQQRARAGRDGGGVKPAATDSDVES